MRTTSNVGSPSKTVCTLQAEQEGYCRGCTNPWGDKPRLGQSVFGCKGQVYLERLAGYSIHACTGAWKRALAKIEAEKMSTSPAGRMHFTPHLGQWPMPARHVLASSGPGPKTEGPMPNSGNSGDGRFGDGVVKFFLF